MELELSVECNSVLQTAARRYCRGGIVGLWNTQSSRL